eukprot:GILK01009462.1.p1 GENE.GILK01009462.1~~GILK01009462.1.p1  ORF type:complete len:681 (-),score=169.31 GILK01009462.1:61-2058(-)
MADFDDDLFKCLEEDGVPVSDAAPVPTPSPAPVAARVPAPVSAFARTPASAAAPASASASVSVPPVAVPSFSSKPIQDIMQTPEELAFTEKYSGLRVRDRVVSKQVMDERMAGRKVIRLNDLDVEMKMLFGGNTEIATDFVLLGVVGSRSDPRIAANGGKYQLWKLTDLCNGSAGLFLFRDAYEQWWKQDKGCLVAVLNPKPLPAKEDGEGWSFSVESGSQIMKIGQAKDLAYCSAEQKNGLPCSNAVDVRRTRFCKFHINFESRKLRSNRLELSSGHVIPQNKNKLMAKSITPLKRPVSTGAQNLYIKSGSVTEAEKKKPQIDSKQLLNDYLNRRKNVGSEGIDKHKSAFEVQARLASKKALSEQRMRDVAPLERPCLNKENQPGTEKRIGSCNGMVELEMEDEEPTLNVRLTVTNERLAKLLATKIVQEKGGIPEPDPNRIKAKPISQEELDKRKLKLKSSESSAQAVKKPLTLSGRYDYEKETVETETAVEKQRKRKLESVLGPLVDRDSEKAQRLKRFARENDAVLIGQKELALFAALEKKEIISERAKSAMDGNKKEVKVFSCKECGYTAESPAPHCKPSGHHVVEQRVKKRYYICIECKGQTHTYGMKFPQHPCGKCGSQNFKAYKLAEEEEMKKGPKIRPDFMPRGEEHAFALNTLRG